jgi:hypothetical protein
MLGGNGQVGAGHLVPVNPSGNDLVVNESESEPLISREEVVAMLFNVADIAAEAWLIRRLLEDDGEEEAEQRGN